MKYRLGITVSAAFALVAVGLTSAVKADDEASQSRKVYNSEAEAIADVHRHFEVRESMSVLLERRGMLAEEKSIAQETAQAQKSEADVAAMCKTLLKLNMQFVADAFKDLSLDTKKQGKTLVALKSSQNVKSMKAAITAFESNGKIKLLGKDAEFIRKYDELSRPFYPECENIGHAILVGLSSKPLAASAN